MRSSRDSILEQWHGVVPRVLEESSKPRARGLDVLVPGVLERLGLDRKRTEAEILKVWNHLIDPTLAAHAQPA